ncbi:AraC family transcriptional regulator [Xanthomonas citri]|uniref:AraC family transcriptional regulator n=1 Tax=Xanthomonas citri TaxID=346 RepID=UPI00174DF984|nr:helix-turn-helix transcriptional regulator [Xanthomonas citri]MBD4861460.1 helix-turn-helix domain-containing protein [Xanthomonas citri pv. citri]QYF45107.1 AraC family transcriptional regulator [Xanthomonas citri]
MTISVALNQSVCQFDPDADERPAVALLLDIEQNDVEQPVHQHRKGQLVMALRGGVVCEVPKAMWMVPPHHAVWIPGGMPHSNRATDNARIGFLFVEPGATLMPETCCTIAINPMVRELILYLAGQPPAYPHESPTARVAAVVLEQLATAPIERLHLPVSDHPKIRHITNAWTADPADRRTLAQWASQLAMSDRSLARLVQRETGLSFGRWRQQWHLIVALRQLTEGAAVQQVAGNLGYDSVTAFITMSKKMLGKPPAQYFASLR